MTGNLRTAAFRTELELALGWQRDQPLTLRQLAAELGASVARCRYHAQALAAEGRVCLSRDAHGRVLVSLPPLPADYGLVRRLSDGAVLCRADARLAARSAAAARRELAPHSGAPEPGLGVVIVGGFRCWIEPPLSLAS